MSAPAGRPRLAALASFASFALGATACASAEPTYFALVAWPGDVQATPAHLVKLRRPGLAGYLDRPEIVRDVDRYHVHVLTNERWGEPLGDMIARVLAEDLMQRLPGAAVFTEAGAISADPDAVVEVDVQGFEGEGDDVVLRAEVAIERGRGHDPATARGFVLRAPGHAATADRVAAMSRLLGRLADAIATLLRAGPSGVAPRGP